jgi:hypothetical protein
LFENSTSAAGSRFAAHPLMNIPNRQRVVRHQRALIIIISVESVDTGLWNVQECAVCNEKANSQFVGILAEIVF